MAKEIAFTKLQGAGNDFIVIDNRKSLLKRDLPAWARKLCKRRVSVGADGLILVERSKRAHVKMRIFNPDGSEAEMCGNGVRCLAAFVAAKKITPKTFTVETQSGIIQARVTGQRVKARLVDPKDLRMNINLIVDNRQENLHFVNTGVPHAVKIVDDLAQAPVVEQGRAIRTHKFFAPAGTNVNFVSIVSDRAIAVRTYERGVEDETLACGTGSTASALIAAAIKNLKSPIEVRTSGSEKLKIYFTHKDAGFHDVYLEGDIVRVYEGRIAV